MFIFGRYVMPVKLIFFSIRSTLAMLAMLVLWSNEI